MTDPIEITSREQAIELYGADGAAMWDEHEGVLVEMPFRVFRLDLPADRCSSCDVELRMITHLGNCHHTHDGEPYCVYCYWRVAREPGQ
jgi:hypothetical protein